MSEKSVYRQVRELATEEGDFAPGIRKRVRELSRDSEFAKLPEDERGRAILRQLEREGLLSESKAMRGLLSASTDARGEDYDNPVRFGLKDIAKALGYGDDAVSMLDSEHGWEKIPYSRYKSAFGDDADAVRSVLRSATLDYFANVKTPEARKEAMHDGTILGGLARFMFPRAAEAAERKGDVSGKDWALDFAENALSFVPVGKAGALLGRIPKFGEMMARIGAVPLLGNVARRLPDAGFVPMTSGALDAAAYDDEVRGTFSPSGVLEATAFNLGVPWMINQGIGRLKGLRQFAGGDIDGGKAAGREGDELMKRIEGEAADAGEKSAKKGDGLIETAENEAEGAAETVAGKNRKEKAKGVLKEIVKDVFPAAMKKTANVYGGAAIRQMPFGDAVDESLRKDEETNKEERRRAATSAKAAEALEGEDLTDEDREFLAYVRDNPESVVYGMPYGRARDRFNTWLLTRGAFLRRPGWSAEGK